MKFLYNLGIGLISVLFKIAGLFNGKARLFVSGRKGLLNRVRRDMEPVRGRRVWIHCASLGEFEQGRPIIEAIRKEYHDVKIILTFFSPSGYEPRKNYQGADFIYYLPWDIPENARRFVDSVQPNIAIFVKYEFWHNYSRILAAKGIPVISVSSIFREDQLFFQTYGGFYRDILKNFSTFFVQNDSSVRLLRSINVNNVTRAGDTRFDRVYELVKTAASIPVAEKFKAGQKVMVVGSAWQEDIDVLVPLINEHQMKFIVAPHEITESFILDFENSLQVKSIRYSKAADAKLEDYDVLIIDNIGMLSKLYRYGEFAFVGGAFGKGLHNILEAACYGVPILFGNKNFQKFQEAVDLINRGGAFEVADYTDLKAKYEMLNVPENFMLACEVTRQYVEENLGATEKIMKYCRKILSQQ
jgi:3-deoxy-D-manno-octulosonic-acid transferase